MRILTGITPSGTPHLGNFVGAIQPAIAASGESDTGHADTFLFLADYHALIKTQDPDRLARSSLEVAATWLACGLDPERVVFYRQSDIPQILELAWLLGCVAAKGLLNRAHAYKTLVDQNLRTRADADAGVSAGLFNYPVLMAADILAFGAERVPVGADQVQHLEIVRDIAQRFNHIYGDVLVLPQAEVRNELVLPGRDGRKMSKSYDNTIPLFEPEKKLRKDIMHILTDSLEPGEPKPTDCALFQLYCAFATSEAVAEMKQAFADGIGWGDAKQRVFVAVNEMLATPRERYTELMAHPDRIEEVLQVGARRARAEAGALLERLRPVVGIVPLGGRG